MAVIDHITTNNSATYEVQDTVARIKANNLESANYTDIGGGFADGNTLLIKTDDGMKKGFLNNFANWILDKLATKVYNQLATSNKTMIGALNELNSNSLTHAKRITINPSDGKSIILDDASSYLICYAGIDTDNIRNAGFAVALSRTSKEKTGGILSIKSELTGTNFALDGNTLKVSTNVWIVMTLTKI